MFDRTQYPNLYSFFENAAGHLLATYRMKSNQDSSVPPEVLRQLSSLDNKFAVVVVGLVVHLFDHPELLAEAEYLLQPRGCPAQMIPILEAHLGIECD